MKNINNRNTNSDDALTAFSELVECLWAFGKLALIVYVLYRITVVLGLAPEGFF